MLNLTRRERRDFGDLLTAILNGLGDGPKLQSYLANECDLGYASIARWIDVLLRVGIVRINRVEEHGKRTWRWVALTKNGRKMLEGLETK